MSRYVLQCWKAISVRPKAVAAACAIAAVVCLSCGIVRWFDRYPDAESIAEIRADDDHPRITTSIRTAEVTTIPPTIKPIDGGDNDWPHPSRIEPVSHDQFGSVPVSSFLARFTEPATSQIRRKSETDLDRSASQAVWLSGCIEVGEESMLTPEHL